MRLFLILAGFLTAFTAAAPIKVWVELTDKGPGPSTTLSDRGLPLQGQRAYEDAPIYPAYLQQLTAAGFTVDVILKWQNKVSGWIETDKLADLNRLQIVRKVEDMPRKAPYVHLPVLRAGSVLAKTQVEAAISFGAFQTVFDTTQASLLRNKVAAANQTAGQGMKIAVVDEGFYLGHEAFAHMKQAGLIVDQWDFVGKKAVVVKDSLGDSHGAEVLSLIGGKSSTFEGLVPDAKFLLYHAENVASETYVEEDYVAAAIERAVDSGAKVISISLGYRYDYSDSSSNLPYSSMNGRTRPSSLAALGAARRNVLVSVSMGNEGSSQPSPSLSAPADADSILSVGILDLTLKPCSYTSTGPTFDKRVKPEISTVAPGAGCTVPLANPTTAAGVINAGGTSFAAPVAAGIAVLLRQLHPAASAQAVRLALIATAAKNAHPDSASGYGLVRSAKADSILSLPLGIAEKKFRVTVPWRIGFDASTLDLRDLKGRKLSAKRAGTVIFAIP